MKPLNPKTNVLIIIASIIILFACRKSHSYSSTPVPDPTPTLVTASVAGSITDLNNAPVSNALVTAGASTTTTDANGLFNFSNIQLSKDAGFVQVAKAGYFAGSRTFLVKPNTINNVKIELIPKTVSGNFTVASGGNINVTGGGSINFAASSVVNAATGTAYSGDVKVSTFYLNPADANFNNYMPGSLIGINAGNQQKILQSFGMVSAEMNDAAGNKLQIASGKTASVTIPIPSSMQSTAPATIPLWYFDETKGIWKQEGTATRQTNNYVGNVAHFSFWTAGQLGQNVRLDATFVVDTFSAIPLSNKLVTITSANYGTTNGYTDNAGTVSGLVPANETLVMKVFNDCGDSIYMKNIGPFGADANLGTIKISTSSSWYYFLSNITITGTAANCNNAPVTNGTAKITSGSSQYESPINNGNFSISFNRCSNNNVPLSLIVLDAATGLSSTAQTINISGGTMNIGQISVCAITKADFSYTAQGAAVPVTVTFTDHSTNCTSWLWNFGDGGTSNQQNPTHIYTIAGDYTITLSVTGLSGTSSISTTIHIPATANEYYINLTMNGTIYSWTYPDSINANHIDTSGGAFNSTLIQTSIQAISGNWIYFYILNDNTLPGNYNITLSTFINGKSYPNNNATTTVTEYGAIGNYVSGTASGQMRELNSTTDIPFTLTYKAKRIH